MSAKKSEGFTAEERAAMRERAKELKAEARQNKRRAGGEGGLPGEAGGGGGRGGGPDSAAEGGGGEDEGRAGREGVGVAELAQMEEPDRAYALRVHEIVKA